MKGLGEIKERLEAATPGPWVPYWNGEVDFFGSPNGSFLFDADSFEPEDAEFIANAPVDMRRLIARVERLEAALNEIVADVRLDAYAFNELAATVHERALAALEEDDEA